MCFATVHNWTASRRVPEEDQHIGGQDHEKWGLGITLGESLLRKLPPTYLLRCRGGHPSDQTERVAFRGHCRVPRRQFQAVCSIAVGSAIPCWRA